MRLYSYIVRWDFGFAPNPFFGVCTLATCKPKIRDRARIGDWIIGTGSKTNCLEGTLVFAMRVTETMSFTDYWNDERFRQKKPNLRSGLKHAYGDNIYFRSSKHIWHQEPSHHSNQNGSPNWSNVERDTSADRVLIGNHYVYWGGCGPNIPARVRCYQGYDLVCRRQGHKCLIPDEMIDRFIAWFDFNNQFGYFGEPFEWSKGKW